MEKKITLFAGSLNCGGAERVIVTLSNSFLRKGYSVELLIPNLNGTLLNEVNTGVSLVSLKSNNAIESLFKLIKYLKKSKPEILLSTLPTINIIAILACKLAKTKTKLFVRVSINASSGSSFETNKKTKVVSFLRNISLRYANNIIAPSEGVAIDLIENLGLDKKTISVIKNPIEFENIHQLSNDYSNYAFHIDPSKKMVLAVGRLNQQKDFFTLIKAFAEVCNSNNAILVILGEGEQRPLLLDLVKKLELSDKVYMPGFVENPFTFMKNASVFVLSSKYEGLPNVLLQALALGIPIVSTDCPSGPKEILNNGDWGRLVEVGNERDMARCIIEGLNGQIKVPEPYKVKRLYDIDMITNKYLDLFFK